MSKDKAVVFQVLGNMETNDSLHYLSKTETLNAKSEDEDEYDEAMGALEIHKNKKGKMVPWHEVNTVEGAWISIDRMEKIIQQMKDAGATYMAMQHHPDHGSYMFDYGIVRKASEEEHKEFQQHIQAKQQAQIEKKKAELQAEIDRLNKQGK